MARIDRCYNAADFREVARRRLPKWVFEFIDLGTEDNFAVNDNVEAFRRLRLRHRALVDMSERRLGTDLFGKEIAMPLVLGPTGAAGLCWYEGELAMARAAKAAGIPFTMAIGSTTPLEKVAAEAGGELWFQIYIWENRQYMSDLLKRAREAGYQALVVTVDIGLGANREHNYRNDYGNPFTPTHRNVSDMLLRPGWLSKVLLRYLVTTGIPRHANNPPAAANAHGMTLRSAEGKVGWDDFAWLRDTWPGKLVIKGIQRADDAIRAVDLGADAVVVSNHGGRNMDSAVATIDVLPDIAAAVGDRTTVLIDSGVRRGSDIVKALALGADAVLLGRPAIWAVAAGGEAGVGRLLGLLRRELELTLSHVGSRGPADIGADIFAGTGTARPPRPADRSRPIATLAATAGKEGNP